MQAAARKTDTALNRMGNGVGARMARQMEPAIVKLKQMQSIAAQTGNVLGKVGKGAAMGAGGVVAGGVTAAAMMRKPIDYEKTVARMAITADKGDTVAGFEKVKTDIVQGISYATKADVGGGTRDAAAGALDKMLSSGVYKTHGDAIAQLPAIMQTATASGADATDIASMANKLIQSGMVKPEQLGQALDMAVKAGKEGGFELKDMARWLPEQISAGSQSGLNGMDGYKQILVMNQAAVTAAGSTDNAGNNVVNALAKLNSADTSKDFKKATGKDLGKYLQNEAGQGRNAVQAWVGMLQKQLEGNNDYQKAQGELKNAKTDDEKSRANDAIAKIALGTEIGKLMQDRQALSGFLPMLNPQLTGPVANALNNADGTVKSDFNKYQTTTAAKVESAVNTKDEAASKALESIKPAVDGVLEAFTSVGEAYPAATAAVVALGAAAIVAAAAVGGGSIAGGALDRLGGKGKGKKVTTPVSTTGAGTAAAAGSTGLFSAAAKLLGLATLFSDVASFTTKEQDEAMVTHGNEQKTRRTKVTDEQWQAGVDAAPWYSTYEDKLRLAESARDRISPAQTSLQDTAVIGQTQALFQNIAAQLAQASAASMTAPPAYLNTPVLNATPAPPQQHVFDVKDGKLMVQVQVNPSSSLIEATARASQPFIPLQLAGGGSTNPAGY
jgi:hypothetical protein